MTIPMISVPRLMKRVPKDVSVPTTNAAHNTRTASTRNPAVTKARTKVNPPGENVAL